MRKDCWVQGTALLEHLLHHHQQVTRPLCGQLQAAALGEAAALLRLAVLLKTAALLQSAAL